MEPVRPRPRRRPLPATLLVLVGLAMATIVLVGCGGGSGPAAKGLTVSHVTIDEPINGKTAAVRMTIDDTTGTNDRLIRVRTDAADHVTLHRSTTDDQGRSTMQALRSVEIPAGKKVAFRPGGLHVMLSGLRQPMRIGDHVTLTLEFDHAPDTIVRAMVVPIGSNDDGGSGDMDDGHDMSDMSN